MPQRIEPFAKLNLALKMSRHDIAKSEIFDTRLICEPFIDVQLDFLNEIMEKALKENKKDFVQLLMNNNFNFNEFFYLDSNLYDWGWSHCKLNDESYFQSYFQII